MTSKKQKPQSINEPELAVYRLPAGLALVRRHLAQIDDMCREFHVLSLELFGSAVKETFRLSSDLDFLVQFDQIPLEDYFENFINLQLSLERLFDRKVDLLELQTLKNPYLIESVNQNKVKIYGER
ncbi:nucleotidyltransferase family protein [Algoriphagus sp. A40]|uniref:nucleotidyltransferase family protein n=1 Tax=Algoriphagus sp. A40 TaxID=1945863 RepID=UPI0020C5690A|nr:nucleotidyltransferase domain-containing protein [Algoriphagus sp. A40]